MFHDVAVAFCLVFVIEGIVPFVSPSRWRRTLALVAQLDDRSLRLMGLASMVLGTGLLYIVN